MTTDEVSDGERCRALQVAGIEVEDADDLRALILREGGVRLVADALVRAKRRIVELEALACLGDHHHPDLTYKARLEELVTDYRAAERRIVELEQWVRDLQSGMYINCVYCGHRYGPRDGTPVAMADVLREHIEKCQRHPLAAERARAEAAEAKLAAVLAEWRDVAADVCPGCLEDDHGGNPSHHDDCVVGRMNAAISESKHNSGEPKP